MINSKMENLDHPKMQFSRDHACRVRWSHSTSSSICQSLCRPILLQDGFKEAKERIRETFQKVELSPSSYDTAWVAMVPSRNSVKQPCFPQCLDWILENQREDGSWGLNPSHPLLVKDSLSSTLACLLALRKWRVGDKQVQTGLGFIEKHGWAVDNKDQISPVGFEIIFPSMIKYAEKMNLNLPLDLDLVNLVTSKRDSTIERALQNDFKGDVASLGYMAEGVGELCQWKELMAHQRDNGSLFDSPATTAAALIYHQHDEKCYGYLNSILKLYKNWEYDDEQHLFSKSGKITSHVAIIELHKASQLAIHEKDHILDKISNWTRAFMVQKLLNSDTLDRISKKEVEHALGKFYVTYDRAETRRYIELYEEKNFKLLKAAYRPPSINNRDLLKFSINEFDLGLARYQEELQQLKRWYEDCRLDQLGFSEQYIYISHLISIAILFEHEFSDARLIYAKYVMLITLADDLFEVQASEDELLNIIELVERWDGFADVSLHSEKVKLFFSALYSYIEEVAANAEIRQCRSVKDDMLMLLLEGLKCNLVERLEWGKSRRMPSIEEYLYVASTTFNVRCIVLTAQYFIGIKLSKDIFGIEEIDDLCKYSGIMMRLLNDLQSYKKERGDSTRNNMVSLIMKQSSGKTCEEEAIGQIKETMESNRRKLLGMILQTRKGSQLTQEVKDLFWRTAKAVYFFYSDHDEFRSPKKVKYHIDEVLYKPLNFCVVTGKLQL